MTGEGASSGGRVDLRLLVTGGMPLVVAGVGDDAAGAQLFRRLEEAGVPRLDRFFGAELPRGARVGFTLDADELRLVDERDDALLRTARAGLDDDWVQAARRLRGTMAAVASGLTFDASISPRDLAQAVEERARDGLLLGAIVGVVEERPSLPLIF